jgi:hypothetical protein
MGNCTNSAKDTLVAATDLIRVVIAASPNAQLPSAQQLQLQLQLPAADQQLQLPAADQQLQSQLQLHDDSLPAAQQLQPREDSGPMMEFVIIDPSTIQKHLNVR